MIYWDSNLYLLTPSELAELPDGIQLTSIHDGCYIKGVDYIDGDTRGGYLAYGVTLPFDEKYKNILDNMLLRASLLKVMN